MRPLYFILAILIYSPLNGQQVTKEFTEILYTEEFDNSYLSDWKQESNGSNMFIQQDGFYNLSRLDKNSGSYILPKKNGKIFSDYEIVSTFKFLPNNNKTQSVGIMLNAQTNGSGALVVEVNMKRKFRVRRINTADITNITSQGEDDYEGWLDATTVSKKGLNTLKVVTYQKVFDVYINDEYLYTFTDIQFSEGKIGLYIGENSKAAFDKYVVKGEKEIDLTTTQIKNEDDADKLFEAIIIKLRKNIKNKEVEIEGTRAELNRCLAYKYVDTASTRKTKEFTQKIAKLENENKVLFSSLEEIKGENKVLKAFKNEIETKDEGDIIIALTRATKSLRKQITVLKAEKSALREENNELRKGTSTNDMTTAQKQETINRLTQLVWEKDSALSLAKDKIRMLKGEQRPDEEDGNSNRKSKRRGDYYTDDTVINPKEKDNSKTKGKTLFERIKEQEKNKANQ